MQWSSRGSFSLESNSARNSFQGEEKSPLLGLGIWEMFWLHVSEQILVNRIFGSIHPQPLAFALGAGRAVEVIFFRKPTVIEQYLKTIQLCRFRRDVQLFGCSSRERYEESKAILKIKLSCVFDKPGI